MTDRPAALFSNEYAFQREVVKTAKKLGWQRTYHTRFSIDSEPGFPDLVLARTGRVIFAELKGPKGALTDDQAAWLDLLRSASLEAYTWWPVDWDEVLKVLKP